MSANDLTLAAGERPLITPEGVDLRVRIAGVGERLAALLIDLAILFGLMIVIMLLSLGVLWVSGAKTGEFVAIVMMLSWFILTNAWFIIFEIGAYAATPGKRALGLRVAARNGGRLTADVVIARNGLRQLELFLPTQMVLIALFSIGQDAVDGTMALLSAGWTAIFMLFPLFNRDHLRAGDLIAGTWVVHAPRITLLKDLIDDQPALLDEYPFSREQLDAYGVKELHVLEDVLRRADRKVMAAVADRIRTRIGWTMGQHETDQSFLSAYYAGLRGRLETRMLLGRRKRDKYDRD